MFSSSKASEYFEFLSHCVPSVVPTTKPNPHWTTGTRSSWSQTNSSVSLCNFSEQPWIEGGTTKQRINKSQSWLKARVDRHRTVLLGIRHRTWNNTFWTLQPSVSELTSRLPHRNFRPVAWPLSYESLPCHRRNGNITYFNPKT